MDVLLLAMECNDVEAANKRYRTSSSDTMFVEENNIIAAEESDCSSSGNVKKKDFQHSSFTRKSCHRCGNIRKNCRKCQNCPHIVCKNCVLKMSAMYSESAFNANSCPVCAFLCCCNNKSSQCGNKFHCYRKCPVSRSSRKRLPPKTFPKYCHYSPKVNVDSNEDSLHEAAPASVIVESDTDTGRVMRGTQQERDETDEGQEDPDTEVEDTSCSFSPPTCVPSITPTEELNYFNVTSKGSTVNDLNLKLPGFLSCGLLLGGEVHTIRSSIYPTPSFASRGALMSCDDKMPGDPFYYSV